MTLKDGVPLTLRIAISSSDATPVTLGATLSPWWEKVAVYGADGRQLFWPFEVLERRPVTNAVSLTSALVTTRSLTAIRCSSPTSTSRVGSSSTL